MQSRKPVKKWLLSLLLLLAAILSVSPFVDQRATADFEQLFQRALITFALARTINGVISVVQGTEVALQPAGVGVTLTPGEILDPVNDLVERFSWIMMGASISLGIQNVLLDVSAWWVIQGLVALIAAWILMRLWHPGQGPEVTPVLLKRIFLLLLFIRFAVPVMLIANDLLYQQFLAQRYQQSTEVITVAGTEIEQLGDDADLTEAGPDEAGMLDTITRAWSSTVETVDLSGKLQRLQARAAELVEHLVQLSVVFILQTVLLPAAFLWAFLLVIKRLFSPVPAKEKQS